MVEKQEQKSAGAALFLGLICAGAGCLYAGEVTTGLIIFGISVLGGMLLGPGFLVVVIPLTIWGAYVAHKKVLQDNLQLKADAYAKNEQAAEQKNIQAKTVSAGEFVESLYKLHRLLIAGVLTAEEYAFKKSSAIEVLAIKKPREGREDFLSDLIPLVEKDILNQADLTAIKGYVLL